MALSEAQRKANDKYIANNYKQVKLSMPNAEAEELEAFCAARKLSKAGLIRNAIKAEMARIQEKEEEQKNAAQAGEC